METKNPRGQEAENGGQEIAQEATSASENVVNPKVNSVHYSFEGGSEDIEL